MPGLLCVSDCGALILRPRMPPLALISSIASTAPSRKFVPETAPAPDSSITIGMFTVCCAPAGAAAQASAADANAPIQAFLMVPSSSLDVKRSRALELKNIQAGIRVRQEHEPVPVDVAVCRLDHLRPVRARIHHARRIRRHVE